MKLYYSPGACSLSPHIVLREAGLPFQLVKVNLKTRKTADDADYLRVNPKGYVPALQFDDGSVLTEGPAILQWVADQVPQSHLAPAAGTMERYQLIEWLNFIATELHKQFSPLFNPATPEETQRACKERIAGRCEYVQQRLGNGPYLLGEHFTVADAYLYTVLGWGKYVEIDLARWPRLAAYVERVAARPKVREALAAEKPVKAA
jgi:glutathione S-transferase